MTTITVVKRDGTRQPYDGYEIARSIEEAAAGLDHPGEMFGAGAVEHPDRGPGAQPHHPEQVMRLRLVQPNRLPLGDALA